MANSATALTPIRILARTPRQPRGVITPVVVVLDTTASALTLYTPEAGKYAALLGMVYAESTAHNLTFTSGSTELCTLEQPANTSVIQPIGRPMLITNEGEALKITTSVAITGKMLFYIQEIAMLELLSM